MKLYTLLEDLKTRTEANLSESAFEEASVETRTDLKNLLGEILVQLKILNLHLSVLTNERISEGDID